MNKVRVKESNVFETMKKDPFGELKTSEFTVHIERNIIPNQTHTKIHVTVNTCHNNMNPKLNKYG